MQEVDKHQHKVIFRVTEVVLGHQQKERFLVGAYHELKQKKIISKTNDNVYPVELLTDVKIPMCSIL